MSADYIQLDLFQDTDDLAACNARIQSLEEKQENLRRGIFKRHDALSKAYLSLLGDIESLKVEISAIKNNTSRVNLV
jgi:septation ring formation regulator EzrA